MRVTEGMRYSQVLNNLSNVSSQQAEAAQEASSGVRVSKPSDDPIAAAELARLSASSSQIKAQLSTIDTVRGDAELTESSLSDASDIFVRLKELALQGANGGLTADERSTMSVEVTGLKQALLTLSNARGTRGYLFSGTQVSTPAFDSTGAFQGNDQAHVVSIGNSTPTAVSTSGADAFVVAGGRNVFADLDSLATALASDDEAGIRGAVDTIDLAHGQLVNARAKAGLVLSKLDASQSVLSSLDTQQQKTAQTAGAADPYLIVQGLAGAIQLTPAARASAWKPERSAAISQPKPAKFREPLKNQLVSRAMLIIARRKGQRILIGDDVEVIVTELSKGVVKLGIVAKASCTILRGETKDVADANRAAAATSLDQLPGGVKDSER